GLDAEQQQMVYEVIAYYLQPAGGTEVEKPDGPPMQALDELLRMAASFERLATEHKTQFGGWVLQRLQASASPELWWALGRLGARQPLYASAHHVLSRDTAHACCEHIARQQPDWARQEPPAFAVAQIARDSGDR